MNHESTEERMPPKNTAVEMRKRGLGKGADDFKQHDNLSRVDSFGNLPQRFEKASRLSRSFYDFVALDAHADKALPHHLSCCFDFKIDDVSKSGGIRSPSVKRYNSIGGSLISSSSSNDEEDYVADSGDDNDVQSRGSCNSLFNESFDNILKDQPCEQTHCNKTSFVIRGSYDDDSDPCHQGDDSLGGRFNIERTMPDLNWNYLEAELQRAMREMDSQQPSSAHPVTDCPGVEGEELKLTTCKKYEMEPIIEEPANTTSLLSLLQAPSSSPIQPPHPSSPNTSTITKKTDVALTDDNNNSTQECCNKTNNKDKTTMNYIDNNNNNGDKVTNNANDNSSTDNNTKVVTESLDNNGTIGKYLSTPRPIREQVLKKMVLEAQHELNQFHHPFHHHHHHHYYDNSDDDDGGGDDGSRVKRLFVKGNMQVCFMNELEEEEEEGKNHRSSTTYNESVCGGGASETLLFHNNKNLLETLNNKKQQSNLLTTDGSDTSTTPSQYSTLSSNCSQMSSRSMLQPLPCLVPHKSRCHGDGGCSCHGDCVEEKGRQEEGFCRHEDFFKKQARLQAQARIALAQVRPMAAMQSMLERQSRKRHKQALEGGLEKRRSESGWQVGDLNVSQLQVIANHLHDEINELNDELMGLLEEREQCCIVQDSILVDVEDFTRLAEEWEFRKLLNSSNIKN